MPAKLERCVKKVKKKKGIDSAYAICNASILGKRMKKANTKKK